MKLAAPRWRTPFVVTVLLLLAGLMAPTALAVPPTATASISPSPVPAGDTIDFTFALAPTSGRIGSFNLGAPAGWSISPTGDWSTPPPAGITRATATQIQGRNLDISASSPLSLTFEAQAACSPGNAEWSVAARSGGGFNGSSFSVTKPTTTVERSCTSAFVTPPADAAFNANTNGPSENITSLRFSPSETPIQAIVLDANLDERPGTSVTLHLTAGPAGATLAGSKTAVTNGDGVATFTGSPDPITLNVIGQGYKLTPKITGTEIGTEQPTAFGIYQEGEPCSAGNSCEVHDRATNVDATISAPPTGGGALGGFVAAQPLINCPDYDELTAETIVWVYTGTETQTVTVLLSRQVIPNRGASHIDICYQADPHPDRPDEPKRFTDKFGNVTSGPALLPDCSPSITTNCIVSQTATPGGGRQVVFIVEDGKGRP